MTIEVTYRIVLIGDAAVGKSSLYRSFTKEGVDNIYQQTVGAAFYEYEIKSNSKTLHFQIWDTAGQETYQGLGPIYYRNASAAIAVFDITNHQSFQDLPKWIQSFHDVTGEDKKIFIVANKSDLEDERQISTEDIELYARQNNYPIFMTSAVNGYNVDLLFSCVFQTVESLPVIITKDENASYTKDHSNCC